MPKRMAILFGAVVVLASAATTFADPWPCNLCTYDEDLPKCIGCGYGLGGPWCTVDPFRDPMCIVQGGGMCPMDPCTGGGGGGGDVCMDESRPCPIEIQGVVLRPGAGGSALSGDAARPGRIVSGLRSASFDDVLSGIRREDAMWAGPLALEGWHYAVGRDRIRGGMVAEDGSGYVLSARRTPAGVQVTAYSASGSKPGRQVSAGLLSANDVMLFETSIRGSTYLVMITARGAGSGPKGLHARQVDFLTALRGLTPAGGQMHWLRASEVAGIAD